jgi:FkbM family methyltransferase
MINDNGGLIGLSRLDRPRVSARIARALRAFAALRGWNRLVNAIVPEHSSPFTIRNQGTVFSGDIDSYIDRQVYLFGGYETKKIDVFLSKMQARTCGTILDIGANAGTHSLAFANSFKTVHAFEPNPMLWAQFERNISLNQLTNVALHKVGLSDCDSELTLNLIDKSNYGLGTFSTVEQYDLPLHAVATCPVRHAGNYLAKLAVGSVDAVKIDVQGFEPEVLRGLTTVLSRDRPIIWCEIDTGTLTKVATVEDLCNLVPFEFRCYQFVSKPGLIGFSTLLQEHKGELPRGDYLIVPR